MRLNFTKFKPLPVRTYDLNRYRSYIDYVMEKERKETPSWHCFAIYEDQLIQQIKNLIEQHHDCECYVKDILDIDLYEEEDNDVW